MHIKTIRGKGGGYLITPDCEEEDLFIRWLLNHLASDPGDIGYDSEQGFMNPRIPYKPPVLAGSLPRKPCVLKPEKLP